MRRLINYIAVITLCITFTQCKKSFLDVSSPSNVDDQFVTSTPSQTFEALSWCYANYRQNCIMGPHYRWNDPLGSDAETYCEAGSSNNLAAICEPNKYPVDIAASAFNGLYTTIARAEKVANLIAAKPAYQADIAAGTTSDWTQLYGEAMTMKAMCYFDLVKYFGDVPYGYENSYVVNYSLNSRFDIYDTLISSLKAAEPFMYLLGQGGLTAERLSRTYCDALIGQLALYSGSWQTIRTDLQGLYGNVQFSTKGTNMHNSIYAQRTDSVKYFNIAAQYLQLAITNKGACHLITSDTRSYANNPYQLVFQYINNLQVSPEYLFELGNRQGGPSGQTNTSEYPYAFGRPSAGGSANAFPTKTFGAIRVIPTFYYGDYINGDKRRDASVAVTGSLGNGNETMLSFVPGNKTAGGLGMNKWDDNKMNPPFTSAQRESGEDWCVLRMSDVMLMLAEVDSKLGESSNAVSLVNQIRERAFGNASQDIGALTGPALTAAVYEERKLELVGEGAIRWDMIRSGNFSQRAIAVQQDMAIMVNDLKSQGYHTFANGNVISDYIWTKMVQLANPLTYDADSTNPALYPGWRGQYDYSTITGSGVVASAAHNVAIEGLFNYIDPNGTEAATLQSEGYVKTKWGIDIVNNFATYQINIFSGITSAGDPPIYYWPIPLATISSSNGKVTNGYGLPNL